MEHRRQALGLLGRVVHPADEQVFKCDAALGAVGVVLAGRYQFFERVFLGKRDQLLPEGIIGSVEGNRQSELQIHFREFANGWRDTDR